jgi:hypothetical protein
MITNESSVPVVDEDFLQTVTGNFFDFINNSVVKLQKYTDAMYIAIKDIYELDTSEIKKKNKSLETICNFVFSENENILRNYGVAFINSYINILNARYEYMTKHLASCSEDTKFRFSIEAFTALDDYMTSIARNNLEKFRFYNKKPNYLSEFTNYTNFMQDEFNSAMLYDFKIDDEPFNKNDISYILDGGFMTLISTLTTIKRIAEKETSDMYTTMKCCREVIKLAIILYTIFSIIKIENT